MYLVFKFSVYLISQKLFIETNFYIYMKLNIYKKSNEKYCGWLEIKSRATIENYLKDHPNVDYLYQIEGEVGFVNA